MTAENGPASFHRRLDGIEKRIAELRAELAKNGEISQAHRDQADTLEVEAQAMRKKITGAEKTAWETVRHDLEEDWDALAGSFERWVRHADSEFHKPKS